jgi:D-alanine-D-alanine ligase
VAFPHDRKVLVEDCMRGREVECGVIEDADGTLMTSLPGEIVPSNRHAFYAAKYLRTALCSRCRPTCRWGS